jgi:hypothetical protein
MTLQWILGWWNLIFVAPFAVALTYLAAVVLTGVGMGDTDVDADADADVDADVDADADAHADVHEDADADADADGHDADGDTDHDSHTSMASAALAWLGIGRVPVSLLVIVLVLTWGAAGFLTNMWLRPRVEWAAARYSLPVAAPVSVFVTRAVVMLIGRYVPLNQNLALRRRDHVGEVGQALYGIDEKFGLVVVRDERGDLKQLPCRVAAGVEPIARGARVKLVAYRAADQTFFVRKVD